MGDNPAAGPVALNGGAVPESFAWRADSFIRDSVVGVEVIVVEVAQLCGGGGEGRSAMVTHAQQEGHRDRQHAQCPSVRVG